ncbi:MAG TPA: 3-deoxy-7-phosphoheptulonate synthase [Polyangia bacterium]|jgi:3-deoxy-7-phosphoheptulonate synthase|nr:3-deoxy-7-phosphoheptulonate synthase [Polyangia bacterium]
MIIIFSSGVTAGGPEVAQVLERATRYPGISTAVYEMQGQSRGLVEVHLIGPTAAVPTEAFTECLGVERVFRVSQKYRLLGRHEGRSEPMGFTYNGVRFDQESCHVFAGLCAVDTREHVELMMAACQRAGLQTTRMGAYKPRTSPYDFQGHGRSCLPYVFELAGKYGIRVMAMEVLREAHIDDIRRALDEAGRPTGVMLQIGTRNAQNFELLKQVGQQREFPVLFKRGMGITLEESLNACEYVASEGNPNVVFCLRGVKSHLGDPHRNLVDFAHVPAVKRLTRMPVAIDPSHSVGRIDRPHASSKDGLIDIYHVTAQGLIAGANLVLVDFHPHPKVALCDGPQALLIEELGAFLDDVAIVREAYERRLARAARGS